MMCRLRLVAVFVCLASFLCGFTDFRIEEKTEREHISGVSDPEVGIIVRLDGAPEDVLRESSNHINFGAFVVPWMNNNIVQISIPFKFQPQKFTLQHDKLGFVGATYRLFINYDLDIDNRLRSISLYPFDPSAFRTKEETLVYMNRWIKIIDKAGWKRAREKECEIPEDPAEMKFMRCMAWEGYDKDILYTVEILVSNDTVWKNKKDDDLVKYNLLLIIDRE